MALYRYRVSDPAGKVSVLPVEGDSQADAARRLQGRGLIPLEFLGEGMAVEEQRGSVNLGFGRRFDVTDFTDKLVPLLDAGVPLERALGILAEGETDEYGAKIVNDLRRGLHEGRRLSQLIRDRGRMFPPLYGSVVEAGEEAGALPEVMTELRRFLNSSREFRSYLISALIYPCIVLVVSVGVVGFLLGFIVPRFAKVLQTSSQELPFMTEFLLGVSGAVRGYWWVVVVALIALILAVREIRKGGYLRETFDKLRLDVPVLRRLTLMAELSRLCRTMSILMKSGVHLLDTVNISTRVLQNTRLRGTMSGLAMELRQGERLSQALSRSDLIPPFLLRMVAVGEETGAVDEMLERIAERYEYDLKQLVNRLVSLLEPVVIVLLGLVVGSIVVAMLLAILNLQSGL